MRIGAVRWDGSAVSEQAPETPWEPDHFTFESHPAACWRVVIEVLGQWRIACIQMGKREMAYGGNEAGNPAERILTEPVHIGLIRRPFVLR